MRRLLCVAATGLTLAALVGCGSPDQQMLSSAARAARDAGSEVATVRVVAGGYLDGDLWSQPARRMVSDAEDALGKVVTTFEAEQPTTAASRTTYDRVSKALDDADTAVVLARIAVLNGDRPALRQSLTALDASARDLRGYGELAK